MSLITYQIEEGAAVITMNDPATMNAAGTSGRSTSRGVNGPRR